MTELTKMPVGLPGHKRLVNNSKFSDFTFHVGKKGQVAAHSAVLQIRAPKLFGTHDKKKKTTSLSRELKDSIHENILIELLNFVYTDVVELEQLNISDLLLLIGAAMEYEQKRLLWYCENHVKEILNKDTFFKLYKESSALKQERIVGFCLEYGMKNYTDLIQDSRVKTDLGVELFQEFVAKKQSGVEAVPFDASPPPSTIEQDFKTIYEKVDELEGEFTLFRVGKEMKTFLPAHRAFLAASPDLITLCSQSLIPKTKTSPEHLLVGKDAKPSSDDLTGEAFASLLKYLYYNDVSIKAIHASELVGFCGDFALKDLQGICLKNTEAGIAADNALATLAACYLPQVEMNKDLALEVREKSLEFIADHVAETDLTKIPQLDPRIAPDVVLAIQRKIRKEKGLETKDLPPLASPALRRGQTLLDTQTAEKDKKKKK